MFSAKSNYQNRLSYSQLNTELLAQGFESNCAEYDIDNQHGKIRIRSDCTVDCIIEFMKEKFNLITPGLISLMRRELLRSFGSIPVNLTKYTDLSEIWDKCLKECKPDCSLKQYFIKEVHSGQQYYDRKETIIYLAHDIMPDVIVRHSLEMPLMSFVCNFGGLLGMWLGLSLISISKNIFHSIHDFCNFDRNKIKIFNKNNFNINPQIFIIMHYQIKIIYPWWK